jgi:predicted dehydrogenase
MSKAWRWPPAFCIRPCGRPGGGNTGALPLLMPKKSSVNVAVIGAGAIGLDHIASFQKHPAARVVAVAENNAERGREAVTRFNVPAMVPDYRQVLARADIDIISIALPTYLHASAALDALRAGKHVMIDKPIATSARDAAKIIALAKEKKRKVMVGQNQRFAGSTQVVRQHVLDGKLGEVYHARALWQRRSGIPRIGSWFTQRKFAGGGCT